jgi:hypothetical protein
LQLTPLSSTHFDNPYVWAVYRWQPTERLWKFQKFWKLRDTPNIMKFGMASAYMQGPPGWHASFNPLAADESCFFVRYPAPEVVRLEFDTTDHRFNDRDFT